MGSVKHYSNNSQSVAHRLRESTLKQQELNLKNGTEEAIVTFKTPYPVFRDRKKLNDKQKTTVRLISQYLKDLGLRESVDTLVEETGCKIEHAYGAKLRKAVLSGLWEEGLTILERSRQHLIGNQYEDLRQELVIQKALDLISRLDAVGAIRHLQLEMVRYPDNTELHEIYRLILLRDDALAKTDIMKEFRSADYRQKVAVTIEKMVSPSFMLPQNRLIQLLNESLAYQAKACRLHFDHLKQRLGPHQLLVDHECEMSLIHNPQTLEDTHLEVITTEFSANGKYLATASKTNIIQIYRISKKTLKFTMFKRLVHRDPKVCIIGLSWSGDSRYIACYGSTKKPFAITVFDIESGKIHRVLKKVANVDLTAMAFSSDSYFLAAADEHGHFQVHDVTEPYEKESVPKHYFEGYRIKLLKNMYNDHSILGLDTLNRIRKYSWKPQRTSCTLVSEQAPINNFTLHKSERLLLVSTEHNLNLWDIEIKSLVRRFVRPINQSLIIDMAFGGKDHEYIASGSTTGKIYVYSINDTMPLFKLPQKSHCVNSVSWHPKAPGLFVSASSDETLRVWHFGCTIPSCGDGPQEEMAEAAHELMMPPKKVANKRLPKQPMKKNGTVTTVDGCVKRVEGEDEPMEVDGPVDLHALKKRLAKKMRNERRDKNFCRNGYSSKYLDTSSNSAQSSTRKHKKDKRRNNHMLLPLVHVVSDSNIKEAKLKEAQGSNSLSQLLKSRIRT